MSPQCALRKAGCSRVRRQGRSFKSRMLAIEVTHISDYLSDIVCMQDRWMIAWNNGNRDPSWGVAEIQKMSPPTTGRCYCCH